MQDQLKQVQLFLQECLDEFKNDSGSLKQVIKNIEQSYKIIRDINETKDKNR
jgi:fructose-1,6-bisphosphatase